MKRLLLLMILFVCCVMQMQAQPAGYYVFKNPKGIAPDAPHVRDVGSSTYPWKTIWADSGNGKAFMKIAASAKAQTYFGSVDSMSFIKFAPISLELDSSLVLMGRKYLLPTKPTAAITIDSVNIVGVDGSSMGVTTQVYFGYDVSAIGDSVFASPSAVSSISTGTTFTSLTNAAVAANKYMWIKFQGISSKLFGTFTIYIYWHPS